MAIRWIIVFLAVVSGMGLGTGMSHACSCWGKDEGFLASPHTTVPSNAQGIAWSGSVEWTEAGPVARSDWFTVERRGVGGWQPVPFDFVLLPDSVLGRSHGPVTGLVRPRTGMKPGWQYRFRSSHRSSRGSLQEVLVEVSPEVFRTAGRSARIRVSPFELGPVQTSTRSGMCATRFLGGFVTIDLELPAKWRRRSDALLYVVRLEDGNVWRPDSSLCDPTAPGRNSLGVGREILFSVCGTLPTKQGPAEFVFHSSPDAALQQETHAVEFMAWLPGTSESITGRARVTLSCPP